LAPSGAGLSKSESILAPKGASCFKTKNISYDSMKYVVARGLDTQHNDIQHNDTHHNNKKYDTHCNSKIMTLSIKNMTLTSLEQFLP